MVERDFNLLQSRRPLHTGQVLSKEELGIGRRYIAHKVAIIDGSILRPYTTDVVILERPFRKDGSWWVETERTLPGGTIKEVLSLADCGVCPYPGKEWHAWHWMEDPEKGEPVTASSLTTT